jgi:ABC transporter substrate binding protein
VHRLPAIYEYDPLVREGGLMSYGPDLRESFERAASMVDRIFKGAKPADLPFEQPTRYLFVLNLKTAKSISLEIPPTSLPTALPVCPIEIARPDRLVRDCARASARRSGIIRCGGSQRTVLLVTALT